LDLCLRSAVENRVDANNKIIVIVDGYLDESKSVLEKYSTAPALFFIDNGTNRGMQYSQNIGVMSADTKYVCIVNDDNVFGKEWDKRMMEEIIRLEDEYGDKAVLTPNQIEPPTGGHSMFGFPTEALGESPESFQYDKWIATEPTYDKKEFTNDGQIYPFVMKKKWYLAVGGFDTFYNSPNICDWDFFLKLELLGFTFKRSHYLHLYHFGSVATKKNAESATFKEKEARAFQTYYFKWGAQPYNKPGVNSKIPPDGVFRGFSVPPKGD